MKSNLIGFKQEDRNIFSLERKLFSSIPYCVVRIYGEEDNLKKLRTRIRYGEIFEEDVLMDLNLKFKEI